MIYWLLSSSTTRKKYWLLYYDRRRKEKKCVFVIRLLVVTCEYPKLTENFYLVSLAFSLNFTHTTTHRTLVSSFFFSNPHKTLFPVSSFHSQSSSSSITTPWRLFNQTSTFQSHPRSSIGEVKLHL